MRSRLAIASLALVCSACTVVGNLDDFQSGLGQCRRPDAKTYAYNGNGTMSIELDDGSAGGAGGAGGGMGQGGGLGNLSISQDLGPSMPVTVTHGDDCCWTFRIELSENRVDTVSYCSKDDGLIEKQGEVQLQAWVLAVGRIESTTTIDCETGDVVRPTMEVDETWTHLCSGSTDLVPGDYFSNTTYQYAGPETLDIGSTQVAAQRYLEKRVFSGASSGQLEAMVWLAEDNGQPLKTTSMVTLISETDFGEVTYSEQGEWIATEH